MSDDERYVQAAKSDSKRKKSGGRCALPGPEIIIQGQHQVKENNHSYVNGDESYNQTYGNYIC